MPSYVDRFTVADRVLHWSVAVSFFVLVFSALGLYARTFFGYFDFFGGPQQGILVHKWVGIIFSISSFLLILSHARELLGFDEDDRHWFSVLGGYLSKESKEIPQGKYNAGQKLFGLFALVATVAMGVTGLVIWDPAAFGRAFTQFSLMLHAFFFVLFIIGAIVHIYLATIGNPGTMEGMLYGRVRRIWARKHASKWYEETIK